MKTKLVTIVMFLIGAAVSYGQTTTNSGWGIAGDGLGATIPAGDTTTHVYNISCSAIEHFDGDRNPDVYININGKNWPMYPPSAYSSYFCRVLKYDAVKGKWVQYGFIKATSSDGTQFLGGAVYLNVKNWRVMSFKAVALTMPKDGIMPAVNKLDSVTVYRYNPTTNIYEFDHTITIPGVGGAIWVSPDGSLIMSSVIDYGTNISITTSPIPAPGGLGAPIEPLMPARLK